MTQSNDTYTYAQRQDTRLMGLILAIATILSLAMVAHHPMVTAEHGKDVFAGIIRIRQMDHLVHGGLIILIGLFALCLTYFARCLGLDHPPVIAGVILYNLGCVFVIGAALVDGFLTPDLAERYVAAAADDSRIGFNLLVLCGLAIQSLTKFALVSISAGIFCWSVMLIKKHRMFRVAGAIGFAAALPPMGLVLFTSVLLEPPILLGILAVQSLWNFAVAASMILLKSQ